MRRLAKGTSAFTLGRSKRAAGRDAHSFATRGASRDVDGSGAPSPGRVLFALTLVGLAILALAPVAQAAPKGVAAFFGEGQFGPSSPAGIAVNSTGAGPADPGDIYVIDINNHRLQRFNVLGEFVQMWGKDVIKSSPEVNTDLGNVFESCTFAADCKVGNSGSLGGEFTTPFGVAVDQSNGRVYVIERHNAPGGGGARAQAFSGDGQFLWAIGRNAIKASPAVNTDLGDVFEVCTFAADCQPTTVGTKGGEFAAGGNTPSSASGGGNGIAVVPAGPANAGNVLVTDRANQRVQEFTPAGAFVRTFGADVVPQGGVGSVANNEQQTVTVGASGGTFKLTFNSQTTVALPYNAPATDPGTPGVVDSVQEALNDLTSIKPSGSVTVSDGPGDTTGTSPYKITFGGSLADLDVAQITADSTGLQAGPGRTLTCTGGPTGGTGATTVSYQWLSNGASATGAGATTSTYTVAPADAGKAIQCKVVATHTAGSAPTGSTVVSTPILVATPSGALPTAPGTITIGGNATEGSTLTCPTTGWGGSPSFGFQWFRNGVAIAGATASSYLIPSADVATAANFQCAVTGTNANGSVVKVSANKTTPASPNPPGAPSPNAPTATATVAPLANTATVLQGASSFEICANPAECKAGSGNGANPGQFATNTPNRVAVDSDGNVYTVENSANFRVQKFVPAGASLTPAVFNPDVGAGGPALPLTGTGAGNAPMDVAVGPAPDNHVFVVKGYPTGAGNPTALVEERRVVELTSAGALVDTHAARSGIPGTIYTALNTVTGDIYMPTSNSPVGGSNGIYILGPSSAPTVSMGVSGVSTHTAQLNGLVNPGGPGTEIGFTTKYHFEYRKVGAPTWTPFSTDKGVGNGFATVPVSAVLNDLEANTAYEAKLVASKLFSGAAAIETAPEVFVTPVSPPDIEAVYSTERTATTARLNARINPNGSATTYHFEYGPTAAYGTTVPIPDGSAGSATTSQIFSEALSGLAPATTYHFRLVATNANGTAKSGDHTFITRGAVPEPEGRGYELVSPPYKVGGSGVGPWYGGVGSHGNSGIPAYDGDRFASLSYYGASLADGAFSYGSDWTLADRTPNGWVNKPAFNRRGGLGTSEFARIVTLNAASDDMSLTAWGANGSLISIFPEQPEVFGSSLGTTGGSALRGWDSGRWEVTAPVALGQQVGNSSGMSTIVAADGGYALLFGGLRGVAGAGDPTSSAFSGNPGDWVEPNGNVYIDDVTKGLSDTFPGEGIRSLVNACTGIGTARTVIPTVDGAGKIVAAPCPAALPGRDERLLDPRGAGLTSGGESAGYVSDDGSRVFFMSPDPRRADNYVACTGTGAVGTKCPPQLYVRQRNGDGSVTVRWISRSTVAGQDANLMSAAIFEGATPNGDKAFFRSAAPLTHDDPNGAAQVPGGVRTGTADPSSVDLYMYDFPDAPGADPGEGTLTRISAGPTGAGDANVSPGAGDDNASSLRAFGDDGSRAYFVTAAPLAGVAAPGNGTITQSGGSVNQTASKNLYVYDSHLPPVERWRFVARLPAETAFGECAAIGSIRGRGGLWAGGNGAGQTGTVTTTDAGSCVRPTVDGSFISFFTDGRLTADDPDAVTGDLYGYDAAADELIRLSAPQGGAGNSYVCVTEDADAGALCNGDPQIAGLGNSSQSVLGLVTDPADPTDRVAFFESASRLVPEDENNVYDVYQWRNGTLSLLSTGAPGADHALYQGNDRTGANVYISTRDRLNWEDVDSVLDVYTAHRDGGFPEPLDPPACEVLADGCQGASAVAPAPAGAASTVLSGSGNYVEKTPERPRKCAKGKVRRGKKCVAKKKAKRVKRTANENRRAAK